MEPEGLVVDAKTGVSGAGRGGGTSAFGYAETNEDVLAYGLAEHPHVPEMQEALSRLAGRRATLAFTPHLVPMTRGILATCYARPRGAVTAARLEEAARALYRDEPFVRVVPVEGGRSPRTKWTTGSNVIFVAYAVNRETGLVLALGALDNLGQGRRGPGRPEREPDDRPTRDGGPHRPPPLAVAGSDFDVQTIRRQRAPGRTIREHDGQKCLEVKV